MRTTTFKKMREISNSIPAIKIKDIINVAGKWMELENTLLSEVTQSQKSHVWYVITYKWVLTIKYRMRMLHSTDPQPITFLLKNILASGMNRAESFDVFQVFFLFCYPRAPSKGTKQP